MLSVSVLVTAITARTEAKMNSRTIRGGETRERMAHIRDAGNVANARQSSAGFYDSHVWICQRELWGRAGQHNSASACARATQCSGLSLATQPTQGRAAQVSVIHTFEYVRASWDVGQGSSVLRLLSPALRSVPDAVYGARIAKKTLKMDDRIIDAVRPHLVLYDTNHPDYMKTKMKQDIWNKIAKDLDLSNGKYCENNLFRTQTV